MRQQLQLELGKYRYLTVSYHKKYASRMVIVDACFFEELSRYKWRFRHPSKDKSGGQKRYIERAATINNKTQRFYLHREVLRLAQVNIPDGMVVDHINGNVFDNRLENLRVVTQSQNSINKKTKMSLGYRGIFLRSGKYCAQIRHQGQSYYLGSFVTPEEAAIAYDRKAQELFGEFACLNFAS